MARIVGIVAGGLALWGAALGQGHKIVVTNDDGLTANVVALHAALVAAGHDVVVSVPCQNQSGMSGALKFSGSLGALTADCLNGAARAGAPGVGPATGEGLPEGDFFYVDGTPVMAAMYGLDVVAQRRWGGAPDLVLSGPNGGQNVGSVTLNSGTVGAAQHAAVRGLPAIALSAGSETTGDGLAPGDDSVTVAALSTQLVAALSEAAGDGPLLPEGFALNVNFPNEVDGAAWRLARIGTYNAYSVRFVESVAEAASPIMEMMAAREGVALPDAPGLSFDFNQEEPTEGQVMDESIVFRTDIAVSVMRAGYGYQGAVELRLDAVLGRLETTLGE